jgi:hypothetical protein
VPLKHFPFSFIIETMSNKKPNKDIIRSSAAEYLTFIAATGEGGVEVIYADENIWLSQKMMAELYHVNVRTVNDHLQKVFVDNELEKDSVIRKFRITATDHLPIIFVNLNDYLS